MTRPPPPLLALLGGPGEVDVQARIDDEIRRLAHAEWLRTGNSNEFQNWNEGEKQLGGRLIHTGTLQWLYRELASRDRKLAEVSAQGHAQESHCSDDERLDVQDLGAALGKAEAKLSAREAQLRSELAAEQAKLSSCESRVQELEPALEAQGATMVKRNRHLAECDSCIQSLKGTIERQEAEVRAKAAVEARCQDLESALEAKEAESAQREEQRRQQEGRIVDMEAWLGARCEDMARGLANLAAQGQALRGREERERQPAQVPERMGGSEARLERQRALPPEQSGHGRPSSQALEATVRSLRAELADRDQRLSAERRRVGRLEAVEADLRRELAASAVPEVLELKPWEGHCPEGALHAKTHESCPFASPEELALRSEENLLRDKKIAQHESQAQALSSLLKARCVELSARDSQLQALQAQLAARDRRVREQDRRARQMDKQREELKALLKVQHDELAAGRAELQQCGAELSAQRTARTLLEEQAVESSEVQSNRITELEAQLKHCNGELAEQLVTERALVSHTARLRDAEEEQAQAFGNLLKQRLEELEKKDAQLQAQHAQLQAHGRRLEDQDQHASRLEQEHSTLRTEVEAQHAQLEEGIRQLEEQDQHASHLEQAHSALREELEACHEMLAASEAAVLTRDGKLAALGRGHEEQLEGLEERMEMLQQESLEARVHDRSSARLEELPTECRPNVEGGLASLEEPPTECRPNVEGGLASLEERLALCLAKVRGAAEAAAKRRQAEGATPRGKQAVARSFLTVRGIDYGLLVAQPTVLANFKLVLQQVIALEAGPGVVPDNVSLELWGGSVVVCATITTLPPGLSAGTVEAQLRSSTVLGEAVAERVAKLEGIEEVSTGTLSVIVHNVRPEARVGGGSRTGSPLQEVGHRGLGSAEAFTRSESAPALGEVVPEPSRGISGFFSAFVPSKRWHVEEPIPEDGTVRKRVQELEAKVSYAVPVGASGDGTETPSSEGTSEGAQGPAEATRRGGRFRSRAYSGTVSREGGLGEAEMTPRLP